MTRLYLLQPAVVFQARVNMASITYPLDEVDWDTVTTGAFTDIKVGQTVLFGDSAGSDSGGRQRIRKATIDGTLYVGRSSQGDRDGEVDIADNDFITVLDDFRIWTKTPLIIGSTDPPGIFKDSSEPLGSNTILNPPVANCGPGVAATIDGSNIITVEFDGTASFAVADGATITDYLWDVDDGTITVGTSASSTITATFPAGFRWVSLTVTDDNARTHTARCPVFARDPASDDTVPCQITQRRPSIDGHRVSVRIVADIPASTYPDGTLAMLWDGEPGSASDRSHMIMPCGWHQTDPAEIRAQKTGTLKNVTLELFDVAGRLDSLPGFPQELANAASPENWSEMLDVNVDKYVHYILHWHCNALDLADWTWSGTGATYAFPILGSDGESLWDQANNLCRNMIPDRRLTCNTLGQLRVLPDPMVQDSGDRTAVNQFTMDESYWSDVRYQHMRPPRIHWLRGGAILADTRYAAAVNKENPLNTVFCIAPGEAPGMGLGEQTDEEAVAVSQTTLNSAMGHRYARANAEEGHYTFTLSRGSTHGIQPADMTWVRMTVGADVAAQRGLNFTLERGLVHALNVRYNHAKTGTTVSVEMEWERETEGTPAVTVIQEEAATDPGGLDDDYWNTPVFTTPDTDELPEFNEPGLTASGDVVAAIDDQGNVFTTNNFLSDPPTWTQALIGLGSGDRTLSWIVDPFSPGYRGTGTAINGWIATEQKLFRITDLFGSCARTLVLTFDQEANFTFLNTRTVMASFGRFFATESDNPWLAVVSHYRSTGAIRGTTVMYSQDAGQTWSSEILITNQEDAAVRSMPLYLSPKRPGLAYTVALVSSGEVDGYVTDDWGATWARMTDPDIQPGDDLDGAMHVPWPENDDEDLVYHTWKSGLQTRLKRVSGATITDISPSDGTRSYGPIRSHFGVRTYDSARNHVVVAGAGDDTGAGQFHGVWVSSDNGDNWTEVVAPIASASDGPRQVAFAGDDFDVLFMWGTNRWIQHSSDGGATVQDKHGNLTTSFGGTTEILGIAGGPIA